MKNRLQLIIRWKNSTRKSISRKSYAISLKLVAVLKNKNGKYLNLVEKIKIQKKIIWSS